MAVNRKRRRLRRMLRGRLALKRREVVRLVVCRSSRHIYAQIIHPDSRILVSASTLEKLPGLSAGATGNRKAAILVGDVLARRALARQIDRVSLDRSGYRYHGRVAALVEEIRRAGVRV